MPRAGSREQVDAPAEPDSIVWIDPVEGTPQPFTPAAELAPADEESGSRVLGAFLVAAVVLFVVAVFDWTGADAPSTDRPGVAPPSGDVAGPDTKAAPARFAPSDWVTGYGVAFVDRDGLLRIIDLGTGAVIETGRWTTVPMPPVPVDLTLLGATNATYVVDPGEPERSGELSNVVRMLRLGSGTDRFAFVSTEPDGRSQYFIGSVWGPASQGLATTEPGVELFFVDRIGVVGARPDGSSSRLTVDGFRDLPDRIGRVVAANDDWVAGIHCDDVGRCVGRVADWDFATEIQVPAEVLAMPFVRIAADGGTIVAADPDEWVVHDLSTHTTAATPAGTVPSADAPAYWHEESDLLVWSADDELYAARVSKTVDVRRVPGLRGRIGALGGSEIVLLALPL